MSVTAMVMIKAQPSRSAALAAEIAEVKGVSEVFSVAGRFDLVAIVRAQRNEDLADIVSGSIHSLPGIVESETLIAFRVYTRRELTEGTALFMDE
ncbi:MAG: Lrp/AsnC family transcriptional regulator [Gammaproteobacteria bacterium]|nr:Lrp/AsnC family transcriptional regulator [Gammaproteobacteria bacterium]